jgi:hypothetical protein
MSKGSVQRPTDIKKYREGWERVYGHRAPRPPEEPKERKLEEESK